MSTDSVKTNVCWTGLSNPTMGKYPSTLVGKSCIQLNLTYSTRVRKSRCSIYTSVRRRQYRTDAWCTGIHQELSKIPEQLRRVNYHYSMSVRSSSLSMLSEACPRYLPEPLHDPVRLHRGSGRRRRRAHVLHPYDRGRRAVIIEQGSPGHPAP